MARGYIPLRLHFLASVSLSFLSIFLFQILLPLSPHSRIRLYLQVLQFQPAWSLQSITSNKKVVQTNNLRLNLLKEQTCLYLLSQPGPSSGFSIRLFPPLSFYLPFILSNITNHRQNLQSGRQRFRQCFIIQIYKAVTSWKSKMIQNFEKVKYILEKYGRQVI